jgi:23S rRNA pseudouridine1911/1915/1917 synthase
MGLLPKNRDLSRMPTRLKIPVDASDLQMRAEEVHLRLDQFLQHHLPWKSRSGIQGLIRSGHVRVADGPLAATRGETPEESDGPVERRCGRRVRHGLLVTVEVPLESQVHLAASETGDLEILHEDAVSLVVEKPAGLPVHPSGRHVSDSVIQRVHKHYGGRVGIDGLVPRLCHRLDRETSGIVLIGKQATAHAEISRQFQEHEVRKEYLAIVEGVPAEASGVIDYPIGSARTSRVRLRMTTRADGLPAQTDWRLLSAGPEHSLLLVRIHSGRQHQIRVHCEAIGHPIVGDKLYLGGDDMFERSLAGPLEAEDLRRLGMGRQALHHHRLSFVTPDTGNPVEVISPMPADMERFLADHGGGA